VERVYVFGTVPELPDEDQPAASTEKGKARMAIPGLAADESPLPVFNLDELRRIAVRQALAATGGHKGRAAALLGVHINTMTKFVTEAGAVARPTRGGGRPRRPR